MAEKAEDLNLPISVITRLVKECLPANVIVSKEARTAIARAASVFVLHATTYANQNAISSKRKTINAADVMHGVKELELEELIEPLKDALEVWNIEHKNKSNSHKKTPTKSDVQNESSAIQNDPNPDLHDDITLSDSDG